MDGKLAALSPTAEYVDDSYHSPSLEEIAEFYDEASMDYRHWSRGLNMHIGYFRWGMNPLNRERMLEQINLEIASRLRLDLDAEALLVDLGCGFGSVTRTVAGFYRNSVIKGVTVSPLQVKIGTELNSSEGFGRRIEIIESNFVSVPINDACADGAWAIESACYASGAAKEDLIREMARILRSGGRFVVADSFVIRPERSFNWILRRCYRAACRGWAVAEMPALEHFLSALDRNGFTDIVAEDVSWQAALSVAHAPFAVISFISKRLLTREPLTRHTVNNLRSSLLAPVIGISRTKFRYCMISGIKS